MPRGARAPTSIGEEINYKLNELRGREGVLTGIIFSSNLPIFQVCNSQDAFLTNVDFFKSHTISVHSS